MLGGKLGKKGSLVIRDAINLNHYADYSLEKLIVNIKVVI